MKVLILLAILGVLYYIWMRKFGKLSFWQIAAKYPDIAYDHFAVSDYWKVFEGHLPAEYFTIVPKHDWSGPYRLYVPKLGNKLVYIFGRYPDYVQDQERLIDMFKSVKGK